MNIKGLNKYCKDYTKIENYDLALNNENYVCHHRLETHNSDGILREVAISSSELKALDMYFNRPPEELIFLTKSEHTSLHNKFINNIPRTEEVKQKISKTKKGVKLSNEHKIKLSKASTGKHWFNNGTENVFCYECPNGFVKGMIVHKVA